MIAKVAQLIHKNKYKIDFGLYFTNSVQEEVGLRGAEMITKTIQPDVAIVTDVTHDTSTPKMSKNKEGDLKCGDGQVVTYAPAVENNLRELIIDAGEEKKIELQRADRSRVTDTNTQ